MIISRCDNLSAHYYGKPYQGVGPYGRCYATPYRRPLWTSGLDDDGLRTRDSFVTANYRARAYHYADTLADSDGPAHSHGDSGSISGAS